MTPNRNTPSRSTRRPTPTGPEASAPTAPDSSAPAGPRSSSDAQHQKTWKRIIREEHQRQIRERDTSARYAVEAKLLRSTPRGYHVEAGGKQFWIGKHQIKVTRIDKHYGAERIRGIAPQWAVNGWPEAVQVERWPDMP